MDSTVIDSKIKELKDYILIEEKKEPCTHKDFSYNISVEEGIYRGDCDIKIQKKCNKCHIILSSGDVMDHEFDKHQRTLSALYKKTFNRSGISDFI